MIKVLGFIARRADLTPKQFHDHYRHPYGTLARSMPTLLDYTQSHQLDTDLLDGTQRRFEAIMEVHIAEVEDWFGFRTNSYLVEHLIPDEPNFIDIERCAFLPTNEQILPAPPKERLSKADALWSFDLAPLPVKLVQLVSLAQQDSWASDHDAELGYRVGALRHARSKVHQFIRSPRTEFCAVRELWWPSASAFHAGVEQDQNAWQQLVNQTKPAVTLLVQCEKFF